MEFGIILHIHGVRDHTVRPWSSGSYYTSMEFEIMLYIQWSSGSYYIYPWSSGSYYTSMEFGITLYIYEVWDHTIRLWSSGS
jgi:hypothetical protein